MQVRRLQEKLDWLVSHPEFRKNRFRVLKGVAKWELVRLRGIPAELQLGSFRVEARPHDGIGRLISYFDEKADELFAFMDAYLKPGMTVVDVGANIGTHCLYAGARVAPDGRVFAFEPDPDTCAVLQRNLARNGITNVDVFECALSDSSGRVPLFLNRDSAKTSLVREGDSQMEIMTERLDTILPPGLHVDLLKIDVEGADMLVLEGARALFDASPPSVVVVEIGEDREAMWAFLESRGYRLLALDAESGNLRKIEGHTVNLVAVHESITLPQEEERAGPERQVA